MNKLPRVVENPSRTGSQLHRKSCTTHTMRDLGI